MTHSRTLLPRPPFELLQMLAAGSLRGLDAVACSFRQVEEPFTECPRLSLNRYLQVPGLGKFQKLKALFLHF